MKRAPLATSRVTLDNGLDARCVRVEGRRDACIVFGVRAGSRYEDPAENGISHFAEHMVFRGSSRYGSAFELNVAIEELGGTLDAATHVDYTTYELTLPNEHLEEGVRRLAAVLDGVRLDDLEVERRVLREELLEDLDEDDRDVNIDNLSRRVLFGDHGLGRSITGTVETLDAISADALRRFVDRTYVGANAAVAVVGDLDEAAMLDVVSESFAFLRPGARTLAEPFDPATSPARRVAHAHDTGSQSDVRVSFFGLPQRHPEFVGLSLLARVLDDGASSRLQHHLRDELGLVYDAFAGIDPFEECGAIDVGGSVAHDGVPRLLEAIETTLEALRTTPVPEAEFARVTRRYLWDLERLVEDPASYADFLVTRTLLASTTSVDELAASVRACTPDTLLGLARRHLQATDARVCVVGDQGSRAEEKLRRVWNGIVASRATGATKAR